MADHPDITQVLYSADAINAKNQELADRITADYKDKPGRLVLVGILKYVQPSLPGLHWRRRSPLSLFVSLLWQGAFFFPFRGRLSPLMGGGRAPLSFCPT